MSIQLHGVSIEEYALSDKECIPFKIPTCKTKSRVMWPGGQSNSHIAPWFQLVMSHVFPPRFTTNQMTFRSLLQTPDILLCEVSMPWSSCQWGPTWAWFIMCPCTHHHRTLPETLTLIQYRDLCRLPCLMARIVFYDPTITATYHQSCAKVLLRHHHLCAFWTYENSVLNLGKI